VIRQSRCTVDAVMSSFSEQWRSHYRVQKHGGALRIDEILITGSEGCCGG
jgi:hypothetical protein